MQFHQKESSYVEMNFVLPRGSSLGLYARKNAIPTLTLNDIRDVLSGYRSSMVAVATNAETSSSRHSRSIVSHPLLQPLSVLCHPKVLKFYQSTSPFVEVFPSLKSFSKRAFYKLFAPPLFKLNWPICWLLFKKHILKGHIV